MAGMGLWWILIVVALIALVVWALRSAGSQGRSEDTSPEEILRKRFARGEIDEEEYEKRRRAL